MTNPNQNYDRDMTMIFAGTIAVMAASVFSGHGPLEAHIIARSVRLALDAAKAEAKESSPAGGIEG